MNIITLADSINHSIIPEADECYSLPFQETNEVRKDVSSIIDDSFKKLDEIVYEMELMSGVWCDDV